MRAERRTLVFGALVVLGLAVFVAARLEVSNDISHFLPDGESGLDVPLARELVVGELGRTMLLLVAAPDASEALAAGRRFEARLRAEPRVLQQLDFLEGGPPAGLEQALWTTYQPRRLAFVADTPEEAAARTTPEALRQAAAELKRKLALPVSSLLSRVAPEDPLLILPSLIERIAGAPAEQLSVVDGRFLSRDGLQAVLFLGTRAASFDAPAQRPVLEGVRAAFDAVDAEHGGRLQLSVSGAQRFAVRNEDSMRADIQRVSLGSFVALGLLLLWVFRSPRLVLVTLPVLGTGFLAGTAACLLLFGRVHGLTLAFGSALIGVSIDYTVHVYCHHLLAPQPGGPGATLRALWPGLMLGAATTVIGFVALVASSFPGMRELATFAAVGIGAALYATRLLLPGLLPDTLLVPAAAERVADAAGRGAQWLGRRRALALVPILASLVVAAAGLPYVRWNDDVADLNQLDADLLREDAEVRAQVMAFEQRRLVVARGRDEEEALQVNDHVADALRAAQAEGALGGFRSVAALLPSVERQRAVEAAMRRDAPGLLASLEEALVEEGFVAAAFAPFGEALASPPSEPLRWSDLTGTALQPLVRPFRASLGVDVCFVSFLHELRDEAALRARLQLVQGAHLIDIAAVLSEAFGSYRQRMTLLLLIGLLAVLALVVARHRRLRPTFAVCAPALLAVGGTVGALALAGVPLNLLSLTALLMVVSMGVDYGIFLEEAGVDPRTLRATRLSVLIAALSTIPGFALLASSDHPALASIGLPSAIGISLCLLLAPTVQQLLRPRQARRP